MAEEVRYPDVQVELVGHDGNAFAILGRCVSAARKAGLSENQIADFTLQAMSSDYDNLLQTCMRWFDVH